jgi:mRNA-degrading endonuclease YafQ of YafQ-DinJ toxin-antitoxin module
MWIVYEHRRVDKQLSSVPVEILKRYEKWKEIVAISGPHGLHRIKGIHDEALFVQWRGCRSSRLGLQYRVIYRVRQQQVLVQVIDLTAHNYRRK